MMNVRRATVAEDGCVSISESFRAWRESFTGKATVTSRAPPPLPEATRMPSPC